MSHKATFWLATINPNLITSGCFRVLFHLCDHHNDGRDPERACYPSQETLMAKTGLSNGGLNKCISALEEAGLLRRKRGTIPGERARRTYYILGCDETKNTNQTPLSGDSTNSTPVEADKEQTPLLDVSNSTFDHIKLHPSGEEPVKEPVKEKKVRAKPVDILSEVVGRELASDFCEHRKQKRDPLTTLAAERMREKLRGHPNAVAAINLSIENGWKGVFPDSDQLPKPSKKKNRWAKL